MKLTGKVAVITGAGKGIGFATARLFADEGANVVLNDIDAVAAAAAVQVIRSTGKCAVAVTGDVSVATTAKALAQAGLDSFGKIDILINNAGISGSAVGDGPVTESAEESWDEVMRVNTKSTFLCSRFCIPEMIRRGGGSVVNLSSILALTAAPGFFRSHAYAASKGALLSLTRAMAAYYAPQHVRVNAVCPGLIDTPLADRAKASGDTLAFIAARQPLTGTLGDPAAVADALLFLASDASRLITGTILPVDGGWSTGV